MKPNKLSSTGDNLIQGGGKIPLRLQNLGFNFCKCKEKRCFEPAWNKRVYRFDDASLLAWIKNGGNYGTQTNNSIIEGKYLCQIDFDKKWFMDKVIDKFLKTFTTTSGSSKECLHLWLLTDEHKPIFRIKDDAGDTLCDYFGKDGQIISPNSIHTSGSVYSVVDDLPLAFMPYKEIVKILSNAAPKLIEFKKEKKSNYVIPTNGFYGECVSKLSIADVLESVGIDTQKNPTACPFHSSKREECFSFERNVWNCFDCGEAGNLFLLVKKIWDLNTRETFEKLAELGGLEDEHKEHQAKFMRENGK